MASANKTPGLALNSWLGTDSPKRDDFNEDNARLDAAYSDLAARAESSEGQLAAHASDGTLHVTAEERAQWNSAGSAGEGSGGAGDGGSAPVIGTYVGTGTMSRAVALGFRPRFGYFYAMNGRIVNGDWSAGIKLDIYAAFFSELGSSAYVTLTDSGFTVQHQTTVPPNGAAVKYNENGITYVYVAWR